LAAAGVKNVALISGPRDNHNHQTRAEVVAKHFQVLGHHTGPAEILTGQLAMQKFQAAQVYPSTKLHAIVATNNVLAVGALQVVCGAASRQSAQPVIACVDSLALTEVLPTPFLSVTQDIDAMAQQAVAKLMRQLHPSVDPAAFGPIDQELGFFVSANERFAALLKQR
jgi:DNA-binding LacI/PurR family transcriptional regulator